MNNILITRFSALGDVAMTVPAVYDACRSNPQLNFVLLTKGVPAKVFVERPQNLTVITRDLNLYKGVNGMRRLAAELRKEYSIDGFADLHDVLRTKLLRLFMKLNGVKTVHIDKQRGARKALTRRNDKRMLPLTSSQQKYRDVFRRLGLNLDEHFKGFYMDTLPDPAVFAEATPPKLPDEQWIGIAPFAQHEGKIYPLHLMEQVVRTLAAQPGRRIFLFGAGDKESEVFRRWCDSIPGDLVNMADRKLGLDREIPLLRYCDVMVSMDSANMHLASLTRRPVVSIWGATHPFGGFMGWRQERENTVQLDMVCRPCSIFGNKPCLRGDYHCLNGIPPTLIINRVEAILRR